MRASFAVLLLAVVACTFAQSQSQSVEERCTLYFDDCTACLSDRGCGWCGEYCTSKSSGLCDMGLTTDADQCPSENAPVHQAKRAGAQCSAAASCSYCLGTDGCVICATSNSAGHVLDTNCLPESSAGLCSSAYAAAGTTEAIVNTCPFSVQITVKFIIVVNGKVTVDFFINAFVQGFNQFNKEDPNKLITGINVEVASITFNSGKRDVAERQATDTTQIVFAVSSPGPNYPQSDVNTDVATYLKSNTIPGIDIISATEETVPTGTASTSTGGSSSGHHLSDGALAGIIIGCIIGGAIIAALILYFLVVRKRQSYPAPFRSPAASFRP